MSSYSEPVNIFDLAMSWTHSSDLGNALEDTRYVRFNSSPRFQIRDGDIMPECFICSVTSALNNNSGRLGVHETIDFGGEPIEIVDLKLPILYVINDLEYLKLVASQWIYTFYQDSNLAGDTVKIVGKMGILDGVNWLVAQVDRMRAQTRMTSSTPVFRT